MVALLTSLGCVHSSSEATAEPEIIAAAEPALVDITQNVGLHFVHDAGNTDDYAMPRIMGSGAAMFDYDGDGDLDVLLINGGAVDEREAGNKQTPRATSRLFRQEAGGTFADVTESSGLLNHGYGMGAAVGDVDNDGDLDVYITNFGQDRLFQNNGEGSFKDITESAGIANPGWGTAACFFDYDRDGWLDLFVVNYVDFYPGSICEDGGGRRDYCGPESFNGTADRLYRNTTGDTPSRGITFRDTTVESGIASLVGRGLGVICSDVTDDDRPDIYVANDMEPNRLWIQQPDGTFRDEAVLRGVAVNQLGMPEASMGLAHADFNEDGRPDLLVTHLRGETNTLYLAEQLGLFADGTPASGLGTPSLRRTGFGVAAVDLEHDGDVDVVVANGRVKRGPIESADSASHWADYAEPNQLFLNDGRGAFVEDFDSRTASFRGSIEVSRGLACGDIDNDGDVDLLITNAGGPARLYRNQFAKQGAWLTVSAIDGSLNRDSYGARVQVHCGDRTFKREVNPSSSYLSSHDLRIHFGLGDAPAYDSIAVRWPGANGELEHFPGGASNRAIVLTRGTGSTTPLSGSSP